MLYIHVSVKTIFDKHKTLAKLIVQYITYTYYFIYKS